MPRSKGIEKYERLYAAEPEALGAPLPDITDVLRDLGAPSRILDLGCGQGRDALVAARLGHRVTAVDGAPSGLAAIDRAAADEGLSIVTVLADLEAFTPTGPFDVLLADRTLHMLTAAARLDLLDRALAWAEPGARLLVVDEARNLPAIRDRVLSRDDPWQVDRHERGILFLRRLGGAPA